MPEWMKESSTSFEPNKKETFMLKNRKGILFLLNKFQVSGKRNKTILSDIHPAIQLISTFLLIVLISTAQKVLVLWLLGIYLGMLLLVEKPTILRNIVKKASILILMPLIIYLPIFFLGQFSLLFIVHLFFLAIVISQYMETTNMNQFIAALKIFHFPNIILLQLDITIKYIFFFGNLLIQLLAAVEARAVGGNIQLSTGSNLISLISLKSFTYGKKLDMVMEARGYTGQYYRVNHLVYRYQTKPVFSPCNLEIARGEYLVLMGDNGSGKSTFLNLLAGFLKPSEGTIYFMEQSLTAWKKDPIHKKKYYAHLGILFQETDTQLFNATVYDELAFGPRQLQLSEHETAKRINDCLNLLKITHLSNQVPYQLSGGEKKKVAFASLLVMNPDVYLLDEPFAGLTKESEKLFKKIIKNLHQLGKTIILSTHDYLSICEEADSILLFDSAVTRYSKEEIEANANLLQHLKRY